MTAIWFAFAGDGPCLIESVAAFRKSSPGWKVVIADDSKAPIADSVIRMISPDTYEQTGFHRGVSLNGWAAVLGVIATMSRHASDGILKIDCDTIVRDSRWIDRAAPLCGIMGGRHAHCYGMAYWLRKDAISAVSESLQNRWLDPKFPAPEDQCITGEALWIYGKECAIRTWDQEIGSGWQYKEGEAERCRNRSVITFGNRRLIPGKCTNEKRERVALEMAKFRAFDTTSRA